MSHNELKMRCDLMATGANAHKIPSLYAKVINCIQLYAMEDGDTDQFFIDGVTALHELNDILHTNYQFNDIVGSYINN